MKLYVAGDRVRVVEVDDTDHVKVGMEGTVVDDCTCAPWVRFDAPTGYVAKWNGAIGVPEDEWKVGYMDCLAGNQLEVLEGNK